VSEEKEEKQSHSQVHEEGKKKKKGGNPTAAVGPVQKQMASVAHKGKDSIKSTLCLGAILANHATEKAPAKRRGEIANSNSLSGLFCSSPGRKNVILHLRSRKEKKGRYAFYSPIFAPTTWERGDLVRLKQEKRGGLRDLTGANRREKEGKREKEGRSRFRIAVNRLFGWSRKIASRVRVKKKKGGLRRSLAPF